MTTAKKTTTPLPKLSPPPPMPLQNTINKKDPVMPISSVSVVAWMFLVLGLLGIVLLRALVPNNAVYAIIGITVLSLQFATLRITQDARKWRKKVEEGNEA